MYVAGIQPVGGRGVGGVQPLVAVTRPATATDEAATATSRAATGQMARNIPVDAQTVVFPRGGAGVDWRPLDLRRREAEDRYREADDLRDDDADEADDEDDGAPGEPARRKHR